MWARSANNRSAQGLSADAKGGGGGDGSSEPAFSPELFSSSPLLVPFAAPAPPPSIHRPVAALARGESRCGPPPLSGAPRPRPGYGRSLVGDGGTREGEERGGRERRSVSFGGGSSRSSPDSWKLLRRRLQRAVVARLSSGGGSSSSPVPSARASSPRLSASSLPSPY